MKPKRSKWWFAAFIGIPVLYFAAQFLPFYHSGETLLPSLWSVFWFPEENEQTINFVALFHHGFRINDLSFALLSTQLSAIFLVIISLILKGNGAVAFLTGCWGLFGLYSFLTTRALSFSRVMVYGGIAGILMLLIFLSAVVVSVIYLGGLYKNYMKNVLIVKEAEQSAS